MGVLGFSKRQSQKGRSDHGLPDAAAMLAPTTPGAITPSNPGDLTPPRSLPIITDPAAIDAQWTGEIRNLLVQRRQQSEHIQETLKNATELEALDTKEYEARLKYQQALADKELARQQAKAAYVEHLHNQRPEYQALLEQGRMTELQINTRVNAARDRIRGLRGGRG